MEIVISIVAKIAEYTIAPIGQWLCYSFHYNSNTENLKNQEENFRDFKNRLQHSVEAAIRNGDEIEDDVNKWLTKADHIIELATTQLCEIEKEASTRNSNVACLNLKHRHQLSREAKKMVENISNHVENGNFDRVSYRPASEGMETRRNMDYIAMKSRMIAVKGIMEALGDANINMIGLWGMPGVGKTTLMREVARKVKEDKLFDEVALANVTQSPNLRRIQGEIADMLDLKLDVETIRGRAIRLRKRLTTNKKRIVVILDDIWEKLDLEAIGIDPCKGCKVVLVSRQHNLLSSEMGAQKDFGIEVLPEKEAWELFEKMAGDSIKDPNLRFIATEVAKECDGLPIALVTVSKALRNKKLSFKHLESQEIQYLFLLVEILLWLGLFHGINTLEDARNRLYRQLHNLKDSCLLQDCPHKSDHCHMHDVVRDVATLIASKDYDMLFMSDEWPDMDALKRCKAFSIRGGAIHQLPNELECPELRFLFVDGRDHFLQITDNFFQGMDKLKVLDLTAMKFSSLPSSLLLLRNLQTLCLDGCELGDISAIEELENLVILSLLDSNISALPREIGLLVHLQLFDLSNYFKLEVIPPNVLSRLVELEELYMENSFVQWETEGLYTKRSNNANLAELKYTLRLITLEIHILDACMLPKVLRFEKLERYNILVGDVWDWSDKHECSRTLKLKLKTSFQSEVGIKMLLNRIECLYLDELKGIKSVLRELDREGFQQLKHLYIQNNDEIKYIISSPMHISTISFPTLETFILKNMTGLEDICHGQLHSTSFRNLRVVKVENCEKLKFAFPSSVAMGLSQLQELQIRECSIMGAIVEKEEGEIEDTDMIFFPQLHHLALEHLPKLISFFRTKNLFTTDAREIVSEGTLDFNMPILHEQGVLQINNHGSNVQVSKFVNLGGYERGNSHRRNSSRRNYEGGVPSTRCLTLKDLPNLKRFCIGCNIQFPSLENLVIDHCPKLVTFIYNPSSSSATTIQEIIQTNVEERPPTIMQPLFNVENLRSFFPASVARSLTQLENLEIIDCGVEEIVEGEEEEDAIERTFVFPQVTLLTLKRLPQLKWFYLGVHTLECPMLKEMCVEGCQKVEIFAYGLLSFQETLRESRHEIFTQQPLFLVHEVAFPSLEKLAISHMDKLITIWHDQVAADSFCNFQNLRQIYAEGCESLKSFFPVVSVATSLTQLEILKIVNCGIEEIVARGGDQEATPRIVFPCMTTLNLVGLAKLKWFYPGVHTSKFLS
ncbi:hypothetical protein I3842_08G116200 [Carya illinoinensis]|uniref:AAA+ ATPase domain-containing protein n=1 Tax=Carya illinoinensis TaxID=32201 RepID=A0A922JC25_CARIL|nr:hypothetical protein I3842_08G116200 [Carya illinoinensis]